MSTLLLPDAAAWQRTDVTPFAHQQRALAKMATRDAFALFMEAGTGKTKILIDDAVRAALTDGIDTVIVTAPNKVHRQWALEQLPTHHAVGVPWAAALTRGGTPTAEWRALVDAPRGVLRWFCVNNELWSYPSIDALLTPVFETGRRVALIVDESHEFKSPSGHGSRRLAAWAAKCVRRRIATGTSTANGYEDWYAQFRLLDWRILGCRTFKDFRSRYCLTSEFKLPGGTRTFTKITGYKDKADLFARIAPYAMSQRKRDCLDLPPAMLVQRPVALHTEQVRAYELLRRHFTRELSDGQVVAETDANTRLLRLQQVVGGFLADAEGTPPRRLSDAWPKLTALLEEVQSLRGPVIVWARFRPELAAIEAALRDVGIGVSPYHGGVSSDDKDRALTAWRAGDTQVFLSNPASGGTGLNLTHAADAVWYSRSFDYVEREQGLARIDRAGQTRPVRQVDLVAEGTVDEYQLAALSRKDGVAVEGMAALRDVLAQPAAGG